ncbi:hypothetical protein FRC14_007299, partial [Serendipita sp. 396]
MASASRHASSSYGVTPTVGGSTIVHSTTLAADEDHPPVDRGLTRSPVDISRYPTVYESNGQEQQQQQQQYSRPPSAQPRRSTNVSRLSRVESPQPDSNYPSWLPRRPLAPPPPGSTDGGYTRGNSPGGYSNYGGGGRLADLFNFSRGHSRNITQDSNRVSTAMSGFITNPSEYGGPPGKRTTDDSGGNRKTTGESGESGGRSYSRGKRGSSGDYYDPYTGRSRSVRIAPGSIDHGRGQEPTDQTRRPSSSAYGGGYTHVRGFSRSATNPYTAAMSQSPLGMEPPNPRWMSVTPPMPIPIPRFRARNLNLALLRSPSKVIRLRYLLQPVTYFTHVPAQLFLDFNVVYILVQITQFPTPLAPGVPNTTPSPSWLFALIAYLLATVLWLIGVVVVYEIAWCFWRRWRVKRPGMLGIFSSRPARKLVGMGNYERFCFLEYVQRGAWTDRTELDLLMERVREVEQEEEERRKEEEEHESMGGGWEGKEVLKQARHQHQQQQQEQQEPDREREEEDEPDEESVSWVMKIRRLNYRQGLIEWAWNRSQNLPTVALLIPRACIAFIIVLTFTKINPLTQAALDAAGTSSIATPINASLYPSNNNPARRDETFFSRKNGTLTPYAKTILWFNCAWALWRSLVLIGSYISLWIASGQSCAGVCGPRYRWEELERQEWEDATNAGLYEKFGSGGRRHFSLSGDSTIGGVDKETGDIADQLGWQWRENTRRRVREAYEFCILTPLPRRRPKGSISGPVPKDTDESHPPADEPLTSLANALLPKPTGRKGLVRDLFDRPSGDPVLRDSIQLVPPAAHLPFGRQDPNSRSGPIAQLPYPFTSGANVARKRDSVPFPSPHDQIEEPEELIEGSHGLEPGEEDDLYVNEEDYIEGEVDDMGYLPERPASASMSSLGQPIHPRLQFVGSRTTRGSVSTGVGGSHHSPRTSGYKSTSSKSNSGDQSRRKSKSSGSHYSPRTQKSEGSQQSPLTDSSNQLANILPPPVAAGRGDRRRVTGSVPHLPTTTMVSPLPVDELGRVRTTSQPTSSGVYEVGPEPGYEEEVEDVHMIEEGGSQEGGGEHEDSIGLLSNAPSHQGSMAAIRQRASSLTNSLHRIRTRSQGAASGSNSNSNSGSGNQARSRTRSHNGGQQQQQQQQQRPESHAMSSLGSRSRSSSQSRSRTSSLVPVIGARYTSTRPSEFGVARGGELIELGGGEGTFGQTVGEQPPMPPLPSTP